MFNRDFLTETLTCLTEMLTHMFNRDKLHIPLIYLHPCAYILTKDRNIFKTHTLQCIHRQH